jgi:hypothetical protein
MVATKNICQKNHIKTWDPSRRVKEAVRAKKITDAQLQLQKNAHELVCNGITLHDVQLKLAQNPKDRLYTRVKELLHCNDITKQRKVSTVYPRDIILPSVPKQIEDLCNNNNIVVNSDSFPKIEQHVELSSKQIGNLLHVLKTKNTSVHIWSSLDYHYYQCHNNSGHVFATAQNIDNPEVLHILKDFVYHVNKCDK